MTEKNDSNPFHFLYGIETYIRWKYKTDDYRFNTISNQKKWFNYKNYHSLLDLLNIEIDRGRIEKTDDFLKLIFNNQFEYSIDTRKLLEYICYTIDDKFLRNLSTFALKYNNIDINDFLSVGQVESKLWLIEILTNFKDIIPTKKIAIYGCWYGFLVPFLLDSLEIDLIRGFDVDKSAIVRSDNFLEELVADNWKYKGVSIDVLDIIISQYGVKYYVHNLSNKKIQEIHKFDLIINTSAEHMSDDWLEAFLIKAKDSISKGKETYLPFVLIQTNNMFFLEEHINCCESLEKAIEKYSKYGEVIWAGSKTMITDYERYMVILKLQV